MSQITFEQVSLQFPGTPSPAVDRVNCTIEAGEFVVILGSSGCGKTTLLKMVNRLYEPTQGRITLDQTDIRHIPTPHLRQQMGYVIQQAGLFPHMTVADNVAVIPRLLGWEKPRIQARIHELLELVQLPPQDFRHRYPAQLSGGQQQRVGLARALAGKPRILLMDEPFGALDALTRNDLQTELCYLHQTLKPTILFVSHDVEEALRLADRILVLQQGQVRQFGTPLELMLNPADAFVAQLLGSHDRLRQISVIPIQQVLSLLPQIKQNTARKNQNSLYTLNINSNLRDVLTLMLSQGIDQIQIAPNPSPHAPESPPFPVLTLEDLRSIALDPSALLFSSPSPIETP